MRAEKQLLLDEIKDNIEESNAMVFVKYSAIDPNTADSFRQSLFEKGGKLAVVKKRVFVKAAEAAGVDVNDQSFDGHIAIAFAGEDTVETAKVVYDFQKDNEEKLEVIGGHFDGNLCSAADVKQISSLPGKDEMRSQFLGLLEAPMSQTLATVEALLTSVVYCLENKVNETQES